MSMMIFEKDKYPILDAIRRIIFDRMESYILLIVGGPQRGKSMTAARWAEIWSKEMLLDVAYKLENRWSIGDAEKFLRLHDQKLKRGAITVLDEGGVGIDNQLWYTHVSRAVVYLVKTYGHEGIFTIITDTTGEVNQKVKKHIKGMIVIDKKTSQGARARFFEVQFNEKMNKVYYKFPIMIYKDGSHGKLRGLLIKRPSQELVTQYNNFSNPVKIDLKKKLIEELHHENEKQKIKYFNFNEVVEQIEKDLDRYKKLYANHFIWDRSKIMIDFKMGESRAGRVVSLLEEKYSLSSQ